MQLGLQVQEPLPVLPRTDRRHLRREDLLRGSELRRGPLRPLLPRLLTHWHHSSFAGRTAPARPRTRREVGGSPIRSGSHAGRSYGGIESGQRVGGTENADHQSAFVVSATTPLPGPTRAVGPLQRSRARRRAGALAFSAVGICLLSPRWLSRTTTSLAARPAMVSSPEATPFCAVSSPASRPRTRR